MPDPTITYTFLRYEDQSTGGKVAVVRLGDGRVMRILIPAKFRTVEEMSAVVRAGVATAASKLPLSP